MGFVDAFVDWAHCRLLEDEIAQRFFRGRGVSDAQWARHRLGYVGGDFCVDPSLDLAHDPDACGDRDLRGRWCDSCRYAHWSASWVADGGGPKRPVMGRRLLGSIVFPLTNYAGSTVGFQVRSIEGKAYDTFTVRHRPEGYFFGIAPNLDSIWRSREAWVVEGPFDQLVLERLVAPNVVALTTSALGVLQGTFLRRFVDTINSCLDLDAGGRKGFASMVEHYSSKLQIRDIQYRHSLGGKDVADVWKKLGDDQFKRHMAKFV